MSLAVLLTGKCPVPCHMPLNALVFLQMSRKLTFAARRDYGLVICRYMATVSVNAYLYTYISTDLLRGVLPYLRVYLLPKFKILSNANENIVTKLLVGIFFFFVIPSQKSG